MLFRSLRKAKGIELILEESGRSISLLRDIFTPDFEAVYVNDAEVYEEVQNYVRMIAPDKVDIVKLYKGELPIFDNFAITKQIKSLFGRTVSFKRGAYLILDQAEAMHVIDVNSGTRTRATQSQEENALEVNMSAATEIARQLRLRDLGGIVVIDFIDMAEGEHRQKLYEHMNSLMASDRARHNILPLSKFGLMQITRQRVRPALHVETEEACPTCMGTGKAKPSILLTDEIEEKLDAIVNQLKIKEVTLQVHPYVAAYIEKGWFSMYRCWKRKYTRHLKLVAVQELGFLQYNFLDSNQDIIEVNIDTLNA